MSSAMNSAINTTANGRELQLPWQPSVEEEKRFRRILACALAAFLLPALLMPWLQVTDLAPPKSDPAPTLTKVTLQKRELPPRAPTPPITKPEPKLKPKPKPAAKRPEPKVITQEKPIERPVPKPVDPLVQARKAAAAAGVLAFQDDLQALRDSVDVNTLNQTQTSRGASDAAQLQRALITSAAPTSSGGIKTSAVSTNSGGAALSGRETTRVESGIAGVGKATRKKGPSTRTGGRSDESIRRIMDNNKGAIFSIYNRALRKDPLLEGKLVFEILIDPGGAIVDLKLISSGLADDALAKKILARIELIQFGAEKVTATRVNYSLDFLPYT